METTTQPSSKPNIYAKWNLPINIGILFLFAGIVTAFLWLNQWEPSGNDVWGHMYKSKIMYENILAGNFYPLYSDQWYNGIQLYRYWPPLAYYCMSLLQACAGGNILHAYYLFAGFVVFVGGLPFLFIGKETKKPLLCIACAILWFVLPDNIRVFFCEGNMPRIMTSVVIPYVVYFLWQYTRNNRKMYLIGLILSMTFMTFAHLMVTAITGIGSFLYLCFDVIKNKNYKQDIIALISMILGILIAGIWFIPALSGGMLSMGDSSSGVQDILTYSLTTSLNPMNRVNGVADTYYFGISVLLVAIFGILLAKGKKKAGFCFALFVLLGTTPATVYITKHLPLGEFLWMTRFTALAYTFFFLSLLEWTTLKKKYLIIAVSLLVIDSGITLLCLPRYYTPASEIAKTDSQLIKEHTTQRANIMDLSSYGSYPSWNLVTGENDVDYTFGWAWQGAATAQNIMLINEALEHEEYLYIFDRSMELGDDTVLFRKDYVFLPDIMFEAADTCGYELVEESDTSYLFKKETPEQFGVITEYTGLAIGDHAQTLTIFYPTFTTGPSAYIDDYTADELAQYETIYLSGFHYHNQTRAEELLEAVSAKGTRVVIDAAHIPENGLMQKVFLGVDQEQITLSNSFPNLHYNEETYVAGTFPDGNSSWLTGYTNDPDQVLGYIYEGGEIIPFISYDSSNENIYYLGLNLAYFAMYTNSDNLWTILDDCLQAEYQQLPKREIVPLTITTENNTITIESEKANVNTTLAFQDNFQSNQAFHNENNLLVIDEPTVTLQIVYPKLFLGVLTSVLGILLSTLWLLFINNVLKPNTLFNKNKADDTL
ncbi:MAG: hypothetical protein IJ040_01685 [Lachnospiraceae bacterium]|nr:hypothetical protein [Lachnospiraceae bacterium]